MGKLEIINNSIFKNFKNSKLILKTLGQGGWVKNWGGGGGSNPCMKDILYGELSKQFFSKSSDYD